MSFLLPNKELNQFNSRFRTDYDLPAQERLDRLMGKTKLKLFMYAKKNVAFLGRLLCSIEFLWDEKIGTACTNGLYIKFNPYFFLAMSEKDRVFVLYHELWHVALMHCVDLKNRNGPAWQYATDYVINFMAYEDGLVSRNAYLSSIEFTGLSEPKYDGWTSEAIYRDLLKNSVKIPMGPMEDLEPAPEGSTGKIISAVVQSYQMAKLSKKAGQLPGEFEEIISKFLNPVIPWEQVLQNYFSERCNSDYSLQRPNRRYSDIIISSLVSDGQLQSISWYIDDSGSISDEMLLRFTSEVAYVHNTYNPETMKIIFFDADIQNEYEFEADTPILELKPIGRGGTELEPVRQHILENKPNVAIIMTDLYCDPMRSDPGVEILWAVSNNDNPKVPFGTIIKLPSE